jgi:hypothetical protein
MRTIYRCSFLVGVVILVIVGISGCQPAEIPATLAVTSTPTAITTPAWLANLPAGMVAVLNEDGSWGVESVASSAPHERPPVTAERVKNVSASLEIGLDAAGDVTGLPEGKTQEERDAVKGFYQAIQKKFPTSEVYYNQAAGASEKWVLYAALGGNLFHETISYAGGPEQYFDYPISFDDAKGYWEIVGNYQAVEIPGNGEVGVIWEEGLPQLLADKATLPNGDSYFKYYMHYKTYAEDENPWRDVAGVADILATPTPERLPAEDRWQVSPDGHIAYNEAQLYGGLFTIDTEHPEYAQKYWEDSVRGLWNLNSVGKNTAFLSQFPTADALVKYLSDGGGPVSNLWIPVIYPDARRQFWYRAALESVAGPIDLSQIAISIYKPTRDEIYRYSPSYATGTKFISYGGGISAEVLVEEVEIDGRNILRFTHRRDLLTDSISVLDEGGKLVALSLSEEKTPEEKLLAATQLIKSWNFYMQSVKARGDKGDGWMTEYDPPMLNIGIFYPSPLQYQALTTLEGTPLAIH